MLRISNPKSFYKNVKCALIQIGYKVEIPKNASCNDKNKACLSYLSSS